MACRGAGSTGGDEKMDWRDLRSVWG